MHPLTYVYTNEISPFVHRAKYLVVVQFFTRSSSAFNQFVNPIGLLHLSWKYYFVYVGWLVVETLIVFWFYPETKGPTLEELGDLFEKNDPLGKNGVLDVEGRGSGSGSGRGSGRGNAAEVVYGKTGATYVEELKA